VTIHPPPGWPFLCRACLGRDRRRGSLVSATGGYDVTPATKFWHLSAKLGQPSWLRHSASWSAVVRHAW